jgi:L-asparaginase
MKKSEAAAEVALFFTGGTITMMPQAEDRGVVPGKEFDRFFNEIRPHLQGVGLRPIRWSNLPSPHMTPEHMFRLARDVDSVLAEPAVAGAVVVHGTDVLVESAYMADLVVRTTKPIVYTGSMRYYSEAGYDGVRNLINSIKACMLPLPPEMGVVLLMTDRIFSAREVVKINSFNIDAFEAPESGPVAYVAGEEVLLNRGPAAGERAVRPLLDVRAIESKVALIQCYTGMNGELIEFLIGGGIAGIVLAGFGAGNIPPGAVPSVEAAIQKQIPVIITTQCPEGGVWPIYAYPGGGADLAKKGVISGGRLSGAKARIKLMTALGATRKPGEIREIFSREI